MRSPSSFNQLGKLFSAEDIRQLADVGANLSLEIQRDSQGRIPYSALLAGSSQRMMLLDPYNLLIGIA